MTQLAVSKASRRVQKEHVKRVWKPFKDRKCQKTLSSLHGFKEIADKKSVEVFMRIYDKPNAVGRTQKGQRGRTSSATVEPVAFGDACPAPDASQLMALAQSILARVPDIRTEKVEALKIRLGAHAYNPDGKAVADRLIQEHLAAKDPISERDLKKCFS